MKYCCVTGHRDIPSDRLEYIKEQLSAEVSRAVAEGYTRFLTGMAEGADMLFADTVIGLKKNGARIELYAYLPYRKRMNTPNADFRRIIAQCDGVAVCSEEYGRGCYIKRNEAMVNAAELVIAVYDGREKGGAASTIRYAARLGRDVRMIAL